MWAIGTRSHKGPLGDSVEPASELSPPRGIDPQLLSSLVEDSSEAAHRVVGMGLIGSVGWSKPLGKLSGHLT